MQKTFRNRETVALRRSVSLTLSEWYRVSGAVSRLKEKLAASFTRPDVSLVPPLLSNDRSLAPVAAAILTQPLVRSALCGQPALGLMACAGRQEAYVSLSAEGKGVEQAILRYHQAV